MKQILIKNTSSGDYITRAAGEKLRQIIEAAGQSGEIVELDFTGLKIGSTSFFDEGVAKLKEQGWSRDKLDTVAKFKGLSNGDKKLLDGVCKLRGLK